MTTRQPTQKEIEQVRKLASEGWSCTAIAQILHIRHSTLQWWCKTCNIHIAVRQYNSKLQGHITPEIRQKIKELAEQGNTKSQISDALGLPRTTVRNYIDHHGIETSRHNRKVFDPTPAQVELIKKLFADNVRVVDIAKHLDVGEDALVNKIQQLGLSRKPLKRPNIRRKITPEEEVKLRQLVATGASQYQIHRRMMLTPEIVHRWCEELGLDLQKHYVSFSPNKETEGQVRDLIASGASRSAIAAAIGVSIPTAVKYIRSLGLEVPNHRSTAIDKPRSPKPPRKERVKIEKVIRPKPQAPKPVPVAKTIANPQKFSKAPYEIDGQMEKELARYFSEKRLLTVGFR
jgi:DNA invertase Pin-like site-specific DNA recombinase